MGNRTTTQPSLQTLQDLARLVNTTPEYLAFGIQDGVRTVYRTPERSGMVSVDLVKFDEKRERTRVSSFAIDEAYARDLSVSGDTDALCAFEVPANGLVEGYSRGDRVLVDTGVLHPTQPGVYVYWNGFDASIAQVAALMGENGPEVRLTSSGQSASIPLKKAGILGRVVAHWTRA